MTNEERIGVTTSGIAVEVDTNSPIVIRFHWAHVLELRDAEELHTLLGQAIDLLKSQQAPIDQSDTFLGTEGPETEG